jgi:serine protease AprX
MSAGEEVWVDRAHCALGALASMTIPATPQVLREMVAARFAAQFDERDRLYEHDAPQWQQRVDDAVKSLINANLVTRSRSTKRGRTATDASAADTAPTLRLTADGQSGVGAACDRANTPVEPPVA